MNFISRTLSELQARKSLAAPKRVLAGLDGFVDTIVTPVGLRSGPGEAFTPLATIPEFGQRILGAAGKSTNIELYPRMDKLGGNGPIMAGALLATGAQITYIGALGRDSVHPVFKTFSERTKVVSLCDPAHTIAVECNDGKVMLGQMKSLDEVTFERIVAVMGEKALQAEFEEVDMVALTNWTMIAGMTSIFRQLVERTLPALRPRERIFFFDLADPEKRSVADLREALSLISRFEAFGRVTLGLNLKEAQQVGAALDLRVPAGETESALCQLAGEIRDTLNISTVVVHPRTSAACATSRGTFWIPGPYCDTPLITTGAGDHFNAGFTTGQLLGLSPEACLGLGVCTSGHYVRTAISPSLADLETFLANWK
ncbi:MAG TPA: PfkB family carbohydrate kinase [Opitutaceae bacterium]|nr:PfkB family carbohydrate kinase [Opitutaceae bacterium]